MQKVAVSACLLGEYCRYDGTTKKDAGVMAALKGVQIVPFCPEAPVLGTPRGRISVVRDAGRERLLRDDNGEEVTEAIEAQTRKLVAEHPDLERIILKSKSPSCGLGTTPILDREGRVLQYGDGIACAMFKRLLPDVRIVDEHACASPTPPQGDPTC